jgi:excisionase family DNA binding protein
MATTLDQGAVGLLDCQQVAHLLGCSLRTVRRMCELRRVPFVKVGRLVRFRPADIERYIASNMVEAV